MNSEPSPPALIRRRTMKIAKKLVVICLIAALVAVAALYYKGWFSTAEKTKITADKVLVEKALRRMTLFQNGKPVKTYRIALGKNPVGPKVQEGDKRTPEGIYTINGRNPKSAFHLSLRVSYPGAADIAQAKSLGVSPGGDIMIHGLGNGFGWIGSNHTLSDWTLGCIAVTNAEIEDIWKAVPDGTVVEILP